MTDTRPPCLTVLGGPMAGTRFVLEDGVPNVLVGSDPVCTFHLPLPGVSPMHARIAIEAAGVRLWEAGSKRGLHINDSKVEASALLHNGDIIWLGTPGEADVVMLQCILPRTPAAAVSGAPAEEHAAVPSPSVENETVALDPEALSLDVDSLDHGIEVGPEGSPDVPATAPEAHPEEAGVIAPAEEPLGVAPEEPLGVAPEEALGVAPELPSPSPLVRGDRASSGAYAPPRFPPPVLTPIVSPPPPGFEDETEDRSGESPTVIVASDLEGSAAGPTVEPPVYYVAAATPPESRFDRDPEPSVAPAARPPEPTRRAGRTPRPLPAVPRKAPSVTHPPAEVADKPAPPSPRAPSSSPGLYLGLGLGGLALVAGLAYAVVRFVKRPAAGVAAEVSSPAPTTATPTPMPESPAIAAATVAEATPTPATPSPTAPVEANPTPPAVTRPTPSPSPTKAAPVPTPGLVATAASPSAEQIRSQAAQQTAAQVTTFLGQAEAAGSARQYDQALGFLDEALKLDPGSAKATGLRASLSALRDLDRRRFVPGRTVVATEKAAGGGLSGFEGAAVQKAPDFLGRIEFEMSPPSGLRPGDAWTLKLYVVNEGKKVIRITDLAASALINGEKGGGAASARAREVAPQQRVQVAEMAGTWKEGTVTFSAEVLVTAKGDSLKNTLTWK